MQSPTKTIPTPYWTTIVLERMTLIQNPPERHIQNTHPYALFTQTNQNLTRLPNSIHKEIYNFIEVNNQNINLDTLTNKFSVLPHKLPKEIQKHKETINEYSHPPHLPNGPPPHTQSTRTTNQNTHIITWNAASLNTTLPNLHQLIAHKPTIITIQETTVIAKTSTKYIQNIHKTYFQDIN